MFESSQQPSPIDRSHPAQRLIDTASSSAGFDDDLALGCESAYPDLQIERWRQEVAAIPAARS
jgi:hypothetical protein